MEREGAGLRVRGLLVGADEAAAAAAKLRIPRGGRLHGDGCGGLRKGAAMTDVNRDPKGDSGWKDESRKRSDRKACARELSEGKGKESRKGRGGNNWH